MVDEMRHFEGHLIFNWRTRHMRVVKKLSRQLKSFEFSVKVDVTLRMPEQKEPVAKGDFELPQAKVNEIFMGDV